MIVPGNNMIWIKAPVDEAGDDTDGHFVHGREVECGPCYLWFGGDIIIFH